jgi:hypothetical protein
MGQMRKLLAIKDLAGLPVEANNRWLRLLFTMQCVGQKGGKRIFTFLKDLASFGRICLVKLLNELQPPARGLAPVNRHKHHAHSMCPWTSGSAQNVAF